MSNNTKQDFTSDFLQDVFGHMPSEGKQIFLERYAATDQDSRPTSEGLTQLFSRTAQDTSLPIVTRHLAFSIYQTLVNPFSGKGIVPTTPVTDTSVTIPDSYIGKEYPPHNGLFLGYFNLGKEKEDMRPIFVIGLIDSMNFYQLIMALDDKFANGPVADLDTYDTRRALLQGKMAIASFDILKAAYENKDTGKFAEMFNKFDCIASSSSYANDSATVSVINFTDGVDGWGCRGSSPRPHLLVRAGLPSNHFH